MIRILIVAHAPLASALGAVASHAFSACADELSVLDVPAVWDLELAQQQLRAQLPAQGPLLVLADVLGATPCNAAYAELQGRPETALVHGVNVPMLWRTLCYCQEPLGDLVLRATEGATRGVGCALLLP